MRLFPALRLNRGILGKHIGGAVQPSMPFGRHARRLGRAVVDHPAPPALLGLIIDIALRILPDAAAEPAGMELRAECRPIPPGEYALQESHARLAFSSIGAIGRFTPRSEERRVGQECVSTCRSRGSPDHSKKKKPEKDTQI